MPTLLLVTYAALVVAASLFGGLLPGLLRLGHRPLQMLLSFVGGVMLGVGFFHMLPHAFMLRLETSDSAGHDLVDPLMLSAVLGYLALFLLERFSHYHQHEPFETTLAEGHDCGDHRGHDHAHHRGPPPAGSNSKSRVGWIGAFLGLGVHSVLEGVALAASVVVGTSHGGGAGGALAGLATFLVIVLHKPFDAMTLAALMRHDGIPLRTRVLANILLALLVPLGIVLFWFGAAGPNLTTIAAVALAFSAGVFLCIASSDLLPELQFHRHDRVGLSLALVAGLAFAFGLGRLEAKTHPPHQHTEERTGGPAAGQDDHDHDHDH